MAEVIFQQVTHEQRAQHRHAPAVTHHCLSQVRRRQASALLFGATVITAAYYRHYSHAGDVHTPRHHHHDKDGEHTKATVASYDSNCPLEAGAGGQRRRLLPFVAFHVGEAMTHLVLLMERHSRGQMSAMKNVLIRNGQLKVD